MAILPMKRDEIPTSLDGSYDLLLGAGSEFEGSLTFKGTIWIDTVFKGSIETDDLLVVGEHARMDADITGGTVIVHGQVRGNIRAQTAVELRSTGRVHGDLDTPSLFAEQGCFLEGTVRMGGISRPAAVRPAAPALSAPAHSMPF